jgi:hypothetical protein
MSEKLKLKTYNQTTSGRFQKNTPTIRFHHQGQINLSLETVKLMNLENGDRVEFHQNEKDKKEWYVCKSIDGYGFQLRENVKNNNYTAFTTNNSTVVREVMKSMGVDCRSISFKVSKAPVTHGGKTLHLIITSNPRISQP